MNLSALKTTLGGRPFAILSVADKTPEVLDKLRALRNVDVHRAGTKSEAVSMIRSKHYNLLIIKEDGDWNEVRVLIAGARAQKTDSIIVQGDGVYQTEHLRALLAGADSYASTEDGRWTFDPNVSTEKPVVRLRRQLARALRSFGPGVARAMLEQLHAHVDHASRAYEVADLIRLAADAVSADDGEPIAARTLPKIRRLLHETTVELPDHEPTTQDYAPTTGSAGYSPPPPAAEDQLHWTVRFPEDAGLLRRQPHVVIAADEYPFETVIDRTPGLEGFSHTLSAKQLRGKTVVYELTAVNGAFKQAGQVDWHSVVMSDGQEVSAAGTPPFRVTYRPGGAGAAAIEALLIVDGGSVARQTIELEVVGPGTEPSRRRSISRVPVVIPPESIADRAGADLGLHLTSRTAGLRVNSMLTDRVDWLIDLPKQLDPLVRQAYRDLRALSEKFVPQGDLTLLGQDRDETLLALAQIGSKLHQRTFEKWIDGPAPDELRQLAARIQAAGDSSNPPQLQLEAPDYPLPWGIMYDRPLKRSPTADDVDPNGFWGMRYDLYRDVVPSTILPRRGTRCRLKPIVGDTVPRGDRQLAFVEGLAATVLTGDSLVQSPSSTPMEIRGWAESGDPSDLLYIYCHAVPVDPASDGDVRPDRSSLVFGPTEQDRARVTLRQLGKWWKDARSTSPVVILNACASGQSDAVVGAPFVDFFTKQWHAQAFVGTDWPVQAALADVVGRTLLEAICERRLSLREALRSAINAAAAKGNYFPLMYAIYGPSNVQFRTPV